MDPWLFRRISVRQLVAGQATDVIGRVVHRSDEVVHLMRRDGQIEVVPIHDIIAAREVPDDDRRLRPVKEFTRALLNEMIQRTLGCNSTELRVWTANVHQLESAAPNPESPLLSHANEAWLDSALSQGLNISGPELPKQIQTFVRRDSGALARVVLCGDWFTIAPFHVPSSETRRHDIASIFDTSLSWAKERGAVYSWIVLDRDDPDLLSVLTAHGFVEHPSDVS